MKVYQVFTRKEGISPFRTSLFTAQAEARKYFVAQKKEPSSKRVVLSSVEIRTDLKAPDWIALVESDMTGGEMTLAPRDLVQENTREELDVWERDPVESWVSG